MAEIELAEFEARRAKIVEEMGFALSAATYALNSFDVLYADEERFNALVVQLAAGYLAGRNGKGDQNA